MLILIFITRRTSQEAQDIHFVVLGCPKGKGQSLWLIFGFTLTKIMRRVILSSLSICQKIHHLFTKAILTRSIVSSKRQTAIASLMGLKLWLRLSRPFGPAIALTFKTRRTTDSCLRLLTRLCYGDAGTRLTGTPNHQIILYSVFRPMLLDYAILVKPKVRNSNRQNSKPIENELLIRKRLSGRLCGSCIFVTVNVVLENEVGTRNVMLLEFDGGKLKAIVFSYCN